MKKLTDMVAIVTGARQGIGAGVARVLARHGAHVVLTDVAAAVEETAAGIRGEGNSAVAFTMDVTKGADVDGIVQRVRGQFGRVDILVNNAGIYPGRYLAQVDDEYLFKMFDVNVFGMFRCARAVLPAMVERRYGKIVNVSSVTGPMVADPSGAQTAYASSKAAVWGFTTALALEAAPHGVNVNAICPGHVDTEGSRGMATQPGHPDKAFQDLGVTVPFGRLATTDEVGELAAFLASDEARYITGTHVVIDGGNIIQETYRGPYGVRPD